MRSDKSRDRRGEKLNKGGIRRCRLVRYVLSWQVLEIAGPALAPVAPSSRVFGDDALCGGNVMFHGMTASKH